MSGARGRVLALAAVAALILAATALIVTWSLRAGEEGGQAERPRNEGGQAEAPAPPPAPGGEPTRREPTAAPEEEGTPGDGARSAVPVGLEGEERPKAKEGDDAAGSHDPLGVSEENLEAGIVDGARLAASGFVTYCYGYTGDDSAAYTSGVNRAVLNPEFYSSDGGEVVSKTIETIERDGKVESAALLEDFRAVEQLDDGAVRAEIHFAVGRAWKPVADRKTGEPELAGPVATYRQTITLVPWSTAEAWKVASATLPEPVADASGGGGS